MYINGRCIFKSLEKRLPGKEMGDTAWKREETNHYHRGRKIPLAKGREDTTWKREER